MEVKLAGGRFQRPCRRDGGATFLAVLPEVQTRVPLELVALVDSGKISTTRAQDVFAEMFATGEGSVAIVDKKGLAQVSDAGTIEVFSAPRR